jgi:hypothetical protein
MLRKLLGYVNLKIVVYKLNPTEPLVRTVEGSDKFQGQMKGKRMEKRGDGFGEGEGFGEGTSVSAVLMVSPGSLVFIFMYTASFG